VFELFAVSYACFQSYYEAFNSLLDRFLCRLSRITCNSSLSSVIDLGFWMEFVTGLQHRNPDIVVHGSCIGP